MFFTIPSQRISLYCFCCRVYQYLISHITCSTSTFFLFFRSFLAFSSDTHLPPFRSRRLANNQRRPVICLTASARTTFNSAIVGSILARLLLHVHYSYGRHRLKVIPCPKHRKSSKLDISAVQVGATSYLPRASRETAFINPNTLCQ